MASSAAAMGRRSEMPLLLAGSEGKRGEPKPFNPQGRQREKRGLGVFGCSGGDPRTVEGTPHPRANAPIQAPRPPLSLTLPVSWRVGFEITRVELKQCSRLHG